jgi:hypothetical protein
MSYELITGKILKELTIIGIKSHPVIQCLPAQRYFPAQWKVAQAILILKQDNLLMS